MAARFQTCGDLGKVFHALEESLEREQCWGNGTGVEEGRLSAPGVLIARVLGELLTGKVSEFSVDKAC